MRVIEFTKPYAFAHNGCRTEEFAAGQVVEASDELASCAIADKVAKPSKAQPERESPENAAADQAPEIAADGQASEIL